MVESPSIKLRIAPAERLEATGPSAERVTAFVERWASWRGERTVPTVRVEVLDAPPQHIGLGVGTQLGLSIAAGLNAMHGLPQASPDELAASVGRGARSAVGTYGFSYGGLIVDAGKTPDESIAPLQRRVRLPRHWTFVLIAPRQSSGLSGTAEEAAFDRLPAAPPDLAQSLSDELHHALLPAAARGEFEEFSESLYRYGRLAGECFAPEQGGTYHPAVEQVVRWVRRQGVRGVAQSSWGPTTLAIFPGAAQARMFFTLAEQEFGRRETDFWLSAPDNSGARIIVE